MTGGSEEEPRVVGGGARSDVVQGGARGEGGVLIGIAAAIFVFVAVSDVGHVAQ